MRQILILLTPYFVVSVNEQHVQLFYKATGDFVNTIIAKSQSI